MLIHYHFAPALHIHWRLSFRKGRHVVSSRLHHKLFRRVLRLIWSGRSHPYVHLHLPNILISFDMNVSGPVLIDKRVQLRSFNFLVRIWRARFWCTRYVPAHQLQWITLVVSLFCSPDWWDLKSVKLYFWYLPTRSQLSPLDQSLFALLDWKCFAVDFIVWRLRQAVVMLDSRNEMMTFLKIVLRCWLILIKSVDPHSWHLVPGRLIDFDCAAIAHVDVLLNVNSRYLFVTDHIL